MTQRSACASVDAICGAFPARVNKPTSNGPPLPPARRRHCQPLCCLTQGAMGRSTSAQHCQPKRMQIAQDRAVNTAKREPAPASALQLASLRYARTPQTGATPSAR
eukprot:4766029-Alexandrium_andersonii.AAC.1